MEKVLFPVSGSYNLNEELDASIIIPLYNSSEVVRDQILNWVDEDLKYEIIYVDDKCPQHSKKTIYQTWNSLPNKHKFRVKLICSLKNRGYGGANNLGAYFAQGKNLIFLNSDTLVLDDWLTPMLEVLQDPKVGIVGNLQIKHGGEWHGTIDSAGSEWHWGSMNFLHIGRHICHGKTIAAPMTLDEAPADILKLAEREMVTGCCFAIRKELYKEIGGFNHNYRIGYWEDSEMSLAVRAKGYKVMFQPNSVIYHKLHHSESGGHKFHEFNRHYFFNKWVDSEVIDKFVKAKRIIKTNKVSNILVKRRAANGDVLIATGILPSIKRKYPDAKIYFCTDCPQVLKNNPYIDAVIPLSKTYTSQFQQTFNLDYAYERVPFNNIAQAYSEESNLEYDCPFLYCEPVDNLPKNYVVLHAGKTAWVGRDWENGKHFQKICEYIMKLGFNIVWVGNENDGPKIDGTTDFRGNTTIHQLATIIKDAKFFIGIDSFPFHVAQTFKIPGICYFGSIDPQTRIINKNMHALVAKNLSCLGCHHRKLAPATVTNVCETGTLACEKSVPFEDIVPLIENLMKENYVT
jgi:GT2 family glycosyltransferase/ADP-heptose:LPS heptosyltransferase